MTDKHESMPLPAAGSYSAPQGGVEKPTAGWQYLIVLFGTFLLALIVVGSISYSAKLLGMWNAPYNDLLEFQRSKIANSENIQGIFLGDSSLGNAVNASLFGELSGKHWLNLALTANHGFAGSFNLLKEVLEHQSIDTVVLMNTPDMFASGISFRGYIYTSQSMSDIQTLFSELPFSLKIEYAKVLFSEIYDLNVLQYVRDSFLMSVGLKESFPEHVFENDYIKQSAPISLEQESRDWAGVSERTKLNKSGLFFLKKIINLCREKGLTCLYTHGPLPKPKIALLKEYLDEINHNLKQLGMENGTPGGNPMELYEVGDKQSHLSPSYKNYHTKSLFHKLAPLLAQDSH